MALPGSEERTHLAMLGDEEERRSSDQLLHSEKLFSDRKIFFIDLKENDRGRVVKITEDVRGRRDTIMVPVELLDDFIDALQAVAEADDAHQGE